MGRSRISRAKCAFFAASATVASVASGLVGVGLTAHKRCQAGAEQGKQLFEYIRGNLTAISPINAGVVVGGTMEFDFSVVLKNLDFYLKQVISLPESLLQEMIDGYCTDKTLETVAQAAVLFLAAGYTLEKAFAVYKLLSANDISEDEKSERLVNDGPRR